MKLTMILAVTFAASNQSFLKDKLSNDMSLDLSTRETENTYLATSETENTDLTAAETMNTDRSPFKCHMQVEECTQSNVPQSDCNLQFVECIQDWMST